MLESPHQLQQTHRLYGRRQSRPLGKQLQDCWNRLNEIVSLSLEHLTTQANLQMAFAETIQTNQKPNYTAYKLEIGCGTGEHLIHQALSNPSIAFVGIEPFINGHAKILQYIDHHKLENVRLYQGDARIVLEKTSEQIWDQIDIHYPDPWPKKKHAKRRLIQKPFAQDCVRALTFNGALRITTDDAQYQAWIWETLQSVQGLHNIGFDARELHTKPHGNWTTTRYEQKALKAGRVPHYYCWKKGY